MPKVLNVIDQIIYFAVLSRETDFGQSLQVKLRKIRVFLFSQLNQLRHPIERDKLWRIGKYRPSRGIEREGYRSLDPEFGSELCSCSILDHHHEPRHLRWYPFFIRLVDRI